MILKEVTSVNGIHVRLTQERWDYIIFEHLELEGCEDMVMAAVEDPDFIFEGHTDEILAVKYFSGLFFVVTVYKEMEMDGYVITAYTKDTITTLREQRRILWKKN
jgi:hypothetical protein